MRLERRLNRLEASSPASDPEIYITIVKLFSVVSDEDAFPRSAGPGKPWIGMIQGCENVLREDHEEEADFLRRVYAARVSLIEGGSRTKQEHQFLEASKDPAAASQLYRTGDLSPATRAKFLEGC